MQIDIKSAGSTVIVTPEGIINADTRDKLQGTMDQLVEAEAHQVIFDLSKAQMLMSAAISFFIVAKDQLNEANSSLILAEPSRALVSALKVLGIDSHFNLSNSVAEAVEPTGWEEDNFHNGLPSAAGHKHTEKKENAKVQMGHEVIEELIKMYLPNRLTVDIVDWYVTHNNSIAEPEKIAKALNQKVKPVKNAMEHLSKRHILKKMGGGTYNYGPDRDLHLKLKEFFFRWHCPSEHGSIMSILLKNEL